MAKTLQDYITESAAWVDQPAVGDDFAINIREECLVESHIVDVVEDGVVLAADEGMMRILESYGLLEGDEYQDQIDRFLAGGGKVQQLSMKKPRKGERLGGSRHIGGMGDRPKSRIRGISANTQGTKVVGLPEEEDPYRREVSPPSAEEFEEGLNVKQIRRDLESGMSHDAVIGKHANKRTTNTDQVRRIIQQHAWEKRMNKPKAEGVAEGSGSNSRALRIAEKIWAKYGSPKNEDRIYPDDLIDLVDAAAGGRTYFFSNQIEAVPGVKTIMASINHGKFYDRAKFDKGVAILLKAAPKLRFGESAEQGVAEGISDKIKSLINKLKSLPVVQKNLAAARAKLPEIIAAAQQSKNGQEFVSKLSGQAPVGEGFSNLIKGSALGGLGAFEITAAAELMLQKYIAMGRPSLDQMNYGDVAGMGMLTLMMLVGALAIGMGVMKAAERPGSRITEKKGVAEGSGSNVEKILQAIKHTKQERAEWVRRGMDVSELDQDLDALEQQLADAEQRWQETDRPMDEGGDHLEMQRLRELAGMPAKAPEVTEGAIKRKIDDLYYDFREKNTLPPDADDDTYLAAVAKFLSSEGVDPDYFEDIGELFIDMRDRAEDDDHSAYTKQQQELDVDEGEYDETELYSGAYVRDEQDGPNGEVFRMTGDPYDRKVRIDDRDGRGWYISPSRLTLVDEDDPAIAKWFGGSDDEDMMEAEYQGRKVPLGKPMAGDVKKSKVYVKGPKGNVVKVNFGDKTMRIKKSNPKRRKNFRARHNCANPGPRHKARFWSCRAW